MYFPDAMNFQYFFFSTYPGYFLQALPIALAAGALCWFLSGRLDPKSGKALRLWRSLFVGYLTGLVCLVLLLDLLQIGWYRLLYHQDSGIDLNWLSADFNFVPGFFRRLSGENVGNILLFLPFGILYPLSHPQADWKKTLLTGGICSLLIEVLQPVFGRAFDVNDLILNLMGVGVSAAIWFGLRKIRKKDRAQS